MYLISHVIVLFFSFSLFQQCTAPLYVHILSLQSEIPFEHYKTKKYINRTLYMYGLKRSNRKGTVPRIRL